MICLCVSVWCMWVDEPIVSWFGACSYVDPENVVVILITSVPSVL